MILTGIGIIFSLLPLLSFNLFLIVYGIIVEIIYIFIFVHVYSLYAIFKDEDNRRMAMEAGDRYYKKFSFQTFLFYFRQTKQIVK